MFSDLYKTSNSIKIIANKLTNNSQVQINTSGLIESVTVNGKEQPASTIILLPKDGTYTINAQLVSGAEATAKVTLDTTLGTSRSAPNPLQSKNSAISCPAVPVFQGAPKPRPARAGWAYNGAEGAVAAGSPA